MNFTALAFIRGIRASYWFVPSVMLVSAIALGALMVWLDAGQAATLFDDVSWYQKSKPQGAREVLSTIAGSMITVAGVVFSITIVAISFAANQYGPRILTNFMSDRGNQVTLGTFVATFTYSVVVLRTIHAGDTDFVPQLAVLVAMILALCSIAVLIYFIHHVPESIHINTVTARIGRQLVRAAGTEFPSNLASPANLPPEEVHRLENFARTLFEQGASTRTIGADSDGYLQALDKDHLISVAREHNVVIRLERTPGHFLFCGQVVAVMAPAANVSSKLCDDIRRSWTIGSKRTPDQDPFFLVDELVEIATRALSTGVNDPHTAITCIDWLTASAAALAHCPTPACFRQDEHGELRVIAPTADFALHLQRSFGQLRDYAAKDALASLHFLQALLDLVETGLGDKPLASVDLERSRLIELARQSLAGESLKAVEHRNAELQAAISKR